MGEQFLGFLSFHIESNYSRWYSPCLFVQLLCDRMDCLLKNSFVSFSEEDNKAVFFEYFVKVELKVQKYYCPNLQFFIIQRQNLEQVQVQTALGEFYVIEVWCLELGTQTNSCSNELKPVIVQDRVDLLSSLIEYCEIIQLSIIIQVNIKQYGVVCAILKQFMLLPPLIHFWETDNLLLILIQNISINRGNKMIGKPPPLSIKSNRKTKGNSKSFRQQPIISKSEKIKCKKQIYQWNEVIDDIDRITNKIQKISKSAKKNQTKTKSFKNSAKYAGLQSRQKIQTEVQQSDYPDTECLKLKSDRSFKSIDKSTNKINDYPRKDYLYHSQVQTSKVNKGGKKGQCSASCHKTIQQYYKMKEQNKKLEKEKKQLERKLFFSQIEKKELLKKLENFTIEKYVVDHSVSDHYTQNNTQDIKHIPDNSAFYKSVQLKTNDYQSRIRDQYNTPKSIPLKEKTSCRNIIDLTNSKKKNNICDRSSYLLQQLENTDPSRKFEDTNASPEFRKQSAQYGKAEELQQYFDELVRMSRLQRNKMKKKEIWKEMKGIANELKSIKNSSVIF